MSPRKKPPAPSLLDALLFAPDREHIPGARPVVAFGAHEPPDFALEVERVARARVELSRRGVAHGGLAELDLATYGLPARAPLGDRAALKRRWREARPIVLPSVAAQALDEYRAEIQRGFELFEALGDPGTLAAHVRTCELPEGLAQQQRRATLADPERDVEKLYFASEGPGLRPIRDLWVKSGYLSTHEDDASLRVRVSFGSEGGDDGSDDELRHRLVAELGDALFPETRAATANAGLIGALETACGEEVFLSQPIAYWNAPEGGALFHHDAFEENGGRPQLGACFVQLAGRTAWLALSSSELAARVREFVDELATDERRTLRAELFARASDFERAAERVRDPRALARELALPGCGALGVVVNRGPEFTAFLADAGHAVVLDEGDAILLPNHGLEHTALHSVFCASEHATYALSFAVRSARPAAPRPSPAPPAEDEPGAALDRDEIRRRRRESPRRHPR